MYIDETGIEDEMLRNYGYSKVGIRIEGKVSAIRHNRTSVIGSSVNINSKQKLTTTKKITGTTNGLVFEEYLESILVPSLTFGQCVIMDNARIHKTKRTKELIKQVGCRLLFLPPYSPDYNPIEHLWSALKQNIRSMNTTKETIQENIDLCIAKYH